MIFIYQYQKKIDSQISRLYASHHQWCRSRQKDRADGLEKDGENPKNKVAVVSIHG
jgi:hypothetical protein